MPHNIAVLSIPALPGCQKFASCQTQRELAGKQGWQPLLCQGMQPAEVQLCQAAFKQTPLRPPLQV